MKCLIQIDARQVGSICIDSNTYLSIYDVFKMNNLIQDIRNVLFEKKAFVGRLRNDISKNIAVKSCTTIVHMVGKTLFTLNRLTGKKKK